MCIRDRAYGELTIGVLTDEALIKFDRFPTITFDERFQMIQKLDGVAHVVAQSTVSDVYKRQTLIRANSQGTFSIQGRNSMLDYLQNALGNVKAIGKQYSFLLAQDSCPA